MKNRRQILLFLPFILISGFSVAECQHFPYPVLGIDDGPGSYGPLDATMTLDCLELIETGIQYGQHYGIVRDDKGLRYRVKIGTPIGVGGIVMGITYNKLIIDLPVERNGAWILISKEMPLKKPR